MGPLLAKVRTSKDTLKALADLRKAVVEEAQKDEPEGAGTRRLPVERFSNCCSAFYFENPARCLKGCQSMDYGRALFRRRDISDFLFWDAGLHQQAILSRTEAGARYLASTA
jgi:hypothetical protein